PGRRRPNRLVARHQQRYRYPSTLARRIPQPQNRMELRKPRQSQQKPARQRTRKPAILTTTLIWPETQLNWPETQRSNGRKTLDKTQGQRAARDLSPRFGSGGGVLAPHMPTFITPIPT